MKKKILVVDNHPVILKFMTTLLDVQEGHQVLTAKDGLSALETLKNYTPEVVFLDLVMPNIDGKKLCQIIPKMPKIKDVKLIILSAIAAEQDLDYAELGADACIAKGPLNKMAKHVLAALDQLPPATSGRPAIEVMGLESVHSREITSELLYDKRHLEMILESMSEGILEITPEAKLIYVNPAALSLIGMPEGELLTTDFTDLFSGKDRKNIKTILDGMRSATQAFKEDSLVELNGKQVKLKILPLEEERHKAIVTLKDVSQQKRREAQIQRAQKMEAIGTLAAGIAHDFNNLLMVMQGYTSLMLLKIDSTHPHYEMLKGIEKQVESGAKLTGQLLGYARRGMYEVRPINLNRLVMDTSETFGRTRKEITIHRELAPDLFAIEADQDQIEQVLLNMYVNAADAMPGGGDISLETMNATHKEMMGKLYDPKPGPYILFTITDTGTGMEKRTVARIFDPFFTTKEMGRGTGLGLASAYGIIKGHGGYIDVDSEEGLGTTFKIYLPAKKGAYKERDTEVEKDDGISRGAQTVLLVDDEEMIWEVGKRMLEAMGYDVLIAGDGEEAIEVYKKNQHNIHIVLLDMVMPGMGGGETYDRLKEIDPNIRVILSSGYSINSKAGKILERGCDGFIQKPFNLKVLSQKLREILDKK